MQDDQPDNQLPPDNDLQKLAVVMLEIGSAYRQAMEKIRPVVLAVGQAIEKSRPYFETVVVPVMQDMARAFAELPQKTREALLVLGQHGWYLDPGMGLPTIWKIKNAYQEGKVDEANAALADHYDGMLDEIEKSVVERFPHRQAIISAAFGAHRRGDYFLSIPPLLAQVDGICKEIGGRYLFIRAKGDTRPQIAQFIDSLEADVLTNALLSPLGERLPILMGKEERPEGFNALNRHLVMHGDSLDYGTRENSLRSVSLINFVVNVLASDDTLKLGDKKVLPNK